MLIVGLMFSLSSKNRLETRLFADCRTHVLIVSSKNRLETQSFAYCRTDVSTWLCVVSKSDLLFFEREEKLRNIVLAMFIHSMFLLVGF